MSCVIESTPRDSLQFFQQLGQTAQIRPKSLQLQFGQKCDGNSARNISVTRTVAGSYLEDRQLSRRHRKAIECLRLDLRAA